MLSERCRPPFQTEELPFGIAKTLDLIITRDTFVLTAIPLHTLCDIDVAGFNFALACVAAGIADAVAEGINFALDLSDACGGESDALASVASAATQNAIAVQLDDIEISLAATTTGLARGANRQIEEHLRSCNKLVSLMLPRELGGELETVRDLVDTFLTQARRADEARR